MAQKKSTKLNKKDFISVFNYLISKVNFDEIESDGMLERLNKAVEYVQRNIANLTSTDTLYTEDYDVLYGLMYKPLVMSEIADILGKSEESAKLKVEKLVSNCLAYTFYDKKKLYIGVTYYGRKEYEQYKLRGYQLF
jgi:hypothetical protein